MSKMMVKDVDFTVDKCHCTCGGEIKEKYASINGKLEKVAVCEKCGRTELVNVNLEPRHIKSFSGAAS
jgi:hypothetical protein